MSKRAVDRELATIRNGSRGMDQDCLVLARQKFHLPCNFVKPQYTGFAPPQHRIS
jgi:hypothetical protein